MAKHSLEPCPDCHIWHCPVCGCKQPKREGK
jgi:hypothetical protein